MTAHEWESVLVPGPLIRSLRDKGFVVKLRRFGLACCETIGELIADPRSRAAVEFAERFIDVGVGRRKGRPQVNHAARLACQELQSEQQTTRVILEKARLLVRLNAAHAARSTLESDACLVAEWTSGFVANSRAWMWLIQNRPDHLDLFDYAVQAAELRRLMPLFRDIVGNPFRPVSFDPAWCTQTAVTLAAAIYADRAFDRLPILADALEEAGCDHPDILAHCRGDGPHVRGCWVVDLVLGKS